MSDLSKKSVVDETKSLTRGQWFALAAAFLGWMFDGVEMGLTPIVSRPALRNLLHTDNKEAVLDWYGPIIACFLLGAAAGGILFGWLGDKLGRVRAMVLSILTYSVFMGCGCLAARPWHIGLCLFISALGMGGQWSLGVSLVMECWPQRHRPKLSGVIGAASNVGFLMIAVVGVFFPPTPDSWRWFMLVGASPAVLALLILWQVPESERWKAVSKQKGRNPLVEIFTGSMLRKTLLAIAFAGIPLIGTWASVSSCIPPWANLLAGDQRPYAAGIAQIALSIGAVVGCLIAPVVGGMVGRRPVYFSLCLLSLGACQYMFRFMPANFGDHFIAVAGVIGCVTAAFYGWLPLYLSELFPTRVCATGQGLSFNLGRVLSACGALYMTQFQGEFSRVGATITLIYILGLFLIWFAPETKGKPLPD